MGSHAHTHAHTSCEHERHSVKTHRTRADRGPYDYNKENARAAFRGRFDVVEFGDFVGLLAPICGLFSHRSRASKCITIYQP